MPPQVDVQKIAADYLRRALDHDLQYRIGSPDRPLYGICYEPEDTPESVDTEWLEAELQNARRELADRKYGSQGLLIDELAEEYDVPAEHRSALAHSVLRARVTLWETVLKRTRGDFEGLDGTYERPGASSGALQQPVANDQPLPSVAAASLNGPRFSEIVSPYVAFMMDHGGWRGQTKAQTEATFKMFKEYCGDKLIQAYTRQDLTSFYDLLRMLPALWSKKAKWKGLPLAEIVRLTADETCERITMKTVKRHFSALGALFTYLKKRGEFLGDNPAHGFEFPEKTRANRKRDMWEGEQLTKLFSSPVWTGCKSEVRRTEPGALILKDEKYWLPLLGLFHGNRLEEFAQLLTSDIKREGEIWYFDINDEDDKQLKNDQSKRRVPIHPVIVDLGFLQYLETLGSDPTMRVFPNLQPGGPDNKLGYYFSKWFSRYRQDIGVYRKGLDYHSFRHGVTTKLYAAEVQEAVIDELTGHEGGGVGRKVYKKGLPLTQLMAAIATIKWPEVEGLLKS